MKRIDQQYLQLKDGFEDYVSSDGIRLGVHPDGLWQAKDSLFYEGLGLIPWSNIQSIHRGYDGSKGDIMLIDVHNLHDVLDNAAEAAKKVDGFTLFSRMRCERRKRNLNYYTRPRQSGKRDLWFIQSIFMLPDEIKYEELTDNYLICLPFSAISNDLALHIVAQWFIAYTQMAEEGSVDAMYQLGDMYCGNNCNFMTELYEDAFGWYEKAAAQGHADAMAAVGSMYNYGWGVEQDYAKAISWYKQAIDKGSVLAERYMGEIYYFGNGIDVDYAEAARWCELAAQKGDARAQYILAFIYEEGSGVTADRDKAIYWFRQAAEGGNADAQNNLAIYYHDGDGIATDMRAAFGWFLLAATHGQKEAQFSVGRFYEEGIFQDQNIQMAKYWYEKAAVNGLEIAQEKCNELHIDWESNLSEQDEE